MTLDFILRAALQSMITGHHAPYCYRAHVPGQGYVNDGSLQSLRADYLRQLERDVQSEIANMGFSPDYAEPGYGPQYATPIRGILFANWNRFPRDFDRVLEKAGYAVEWSDEWSTCEDCNKAFRTEPDGFSWSPSGGYVEGIGMLCNS